jgi:hypothetical protein
MSTGFDNFDRFRGDYMLRMIPLNKPKQNIGIGEYQHD